MICVIILLIILYDDFHCASYIFNHANDTFDDGRDDKKKNFFSSAWPTGRREALTTLWRWWTAATWTDSSWSPALGWRFKKIMMIVMTIMMMLVVEMTTRVAVTMNFKILALHRCFVYKEVHTGFLLSQVWRTITIVLEMKRRIEIVHAYFKRSSKCTS